jgi:hypothetical protein
MPELTWQDVWQVRLAHAETQALRVLTMALETDDARLIEGTTTIPLLPREPCAGACPIAFLLWVESRFWEIGAPTVQQIERAFGRVAEAINAELGTRAGRRVPIAIFTDWWDGPAPARYQKRRMLLLEVRRELVRREVAS